MKFLKAFAVAAVAFFGVTAAVSAEDATLPQFSLPAVGGYDVVSYHSEEGPVRGNGHNVVVYKGLQYVFANGKNKRAFKKNPEKYIPAYGGYCAFGVAKGAKYLGDPTVWKVVDGTLYLNLDKKVQGRWEKDIPENIADANENWPELQEKRFKS